MKVITTGAFKKNNVPLTETGIVHNEGEVIEIPDDRYFVLGTKNNPFGDIFVKPYVEEKKEQPFEEAKKEKTIETAKKEDKKETATQKNRKKTK